MEGISQRAPVRAGKTREAVSSYSYQMLDVVQQVVDVLALQQPNVRLAQQTADLLLDLILGHPHHQHEGCLVVQHDCQQLVLVVLQRLLLRIGQRGVPLQGPIRTFYKMYT